MKFFTAEAAIAALHTGFLFINLALGLINLTGLPVGRRARIAYEVLQLVVILISIPISVAHLLEVLGG